MPSRHPRWPYGRSARYASQAPPDSHTAVLYGGAGGYSHLHNISITYEKVSGNPLEDKVSIMETKNPEFSMLSSVKCRNSQEINDFSTLSDTPFYPLFQSRKYLRCCSHSNPEVYHKSTVRPDNC